MSHPPARLPTNPRAKPPFPPRGRHVPPTYRQCVINLIASNCDHLTDVQLIRLSRYVCRLGGSEFLRFVLRHHCGRFSDLTKGA